LNIPLAFRDYYNYLEKKIPYEVAEKIFYAQNYEDPPMRGRQSVNPLNKLGFSIAREMAGDVKITELGNKFLSGDYDIGFIFFKSLLKIQFPNLWSEDFSEKENFNVMPFIAVLHLIYRLNKKSKKKGLDKTEFSVFVPTLINYNLIDEYLEKIIEFRESKDQKNYILNFVREFYETEKVPGKKINNLFDYGDNIMRYFRLTRYFKVSMDPLGYYWNIDIEPLRIVEVEQLLGMYSGKALEFKGSEEYLNYISNIAKPELPWEKEDNLRKIANSVKSIIVNFVNENKITLTQSEHEILTEDVQKMNKEQIECYISRLRSMGLKLKEQVKKLSLMDNLTKIEEIILVLQDFKRLKKYEPEHFEKLIVEVLKIINDEILIKPNYPVDDDGEPINHSPGNKADIECYYSKFKMVCEVTLNTSKLQWIQEGQPVMRHLRDFEIKNKDSDIFCIFIAPQIHKDTYSQFWISVRYEYDGFPQRIVPLTTSQFAILLKTLLELIKKGKRLGNKDLYELYSIIISKSNQLNSFSEWIASIEETLINWRQKVLML